jgi:hypothetical protein
MSFLSATEEELAVARLLAPRPSIKPKRRQRHPMDINVTHLMPETPSQPYVTSERPVGHGRKPVRPNTKRCRHSLMADSNKKLFPPETVEERVMDNGETLFAGWIEYFYSTYEKDSLVTIAKLKKKFIGTFKAMFRLEIYKDEGVYPKSYMYAFAKEVLAAYSRTGYMTGMSLFLQDVLMVVNKRGYDEKKFSVVSKIMQEALEFMTPSIVVCLISVLQEFELGPASYKYFIADEAEKQKIMYELVKDAQYRAELIHWLGDYLKKEVFAECIIRPAAGFEKDWRLLDFEYKMEDFLRGKMIEFLGIVMSTKAAASSDC